ncbi:hypothetical protein, partial [Flavobacterium sp.]|uniref:hypothetical protein n=1 Tax=Flavobacterium sp. TaxID=239 RepID=UPI002620AFCF
ILLTTCCKSIVNKKSETKLNHQYEIVISDYFISNKEYIKKHNVFLLDDKSIMGKNYSLYNIFPQTEYDYFVLRSKHIKENFPSDYIKYKGKIFFLLGENVQNINNRPFIDVIKCLDSLRMLDSTEVKVELGIIKEEDVTYRKIVTNSLLEGVNYLICKDKPYKIRKRIKTTLCIKPDDENFENICN